MVELSKQEFSKLIEVTKISKNIKVVKRAQAVVFSSLGFPQHACAIALGVSERTVRNWIARYKKGGFQNYMISLVQEDPLLSQKFTKNA